MFKNGLLIRTISDYVLAKMYESGLFREDEQQFTECFIDFAGLKSRWRSQHDWRLLFTRE